MGRYSEAEPLYVRALAILLKQLGQEHPNTQTVIDNFATFLGKVLEAGRAEQLSDHPLTQALMKALREQNTQEQ
ncbi:hypothetical protein P7L53_11545 [Thermoleptolyngbya sichuanensis XZ-Cy5]|uniref:hypothetical protein n=1 Tax=Thermoleptolyngbya sichuanensis TaxID=2885951 RepID=UPI00240DAE72|nr:hypothetical protein [Thermoleptolyngbya sichuanensis]MDG2616875.1 hypothetical protein [Thermoleptolyngbya sichuanensis XZ-Cy5]